MCVHACVHLQAGGDNLRLPSSRTIHLIFEISSLTGLEREKLEWPGSELQGATRHLAPAPSTELSSTGQLPHQLLYTGSEEQSHVLILVRRATSSPSFSLKLES